MEGCLRSLVDTVVLTLAAWAGDDEWVAQQDPSAFARIPPVLSDRILAQALQRANLEAELDMELVIDAHLVFCKLCVIVGLFVPRALLTT